MFDVQVVKIGDPRLSPSAIPIKRAKSRYAIILRFYVVPGLIIVLPECDDHFLTPFAHHDVIFLMDQYLPLIFVVRCGLFATNCSAWLFFLVE